MTFGLTDRDLELLQGVLAGFEAVEQALVFGSRAKGTHARGADVDLAVKGERVRAETITRLHAALEDLPLPYFFDVVDYEALTNPALREHIDRVGKILYQK